MPRGRPWSEDEDTTIERVTIENAELGIVAFRPRGRPRVKGDCAAHLERLAEDLGRTHAAVRKRAQRLGAASYRPRGKEGAS